MQTVQINLPHVNHCELTLIGLYLVRV